MRGDRGYFHQAIVCTLVTLAPLALAYAADAALEWYDCRVSLGIGMGPCGLPAEHAERLASFVVVVMLLSPFLLVPALVAMVFWVRFVVSWRLDPGEGVI